MLFRSFVSRVAPPSVTADNGGSTTADTVRLDSRAPFGRQMIVAVVVPLFRASARTGSVIQTPAALLLNGVKSMRPSPLPATLFSQKLTRALRPFTSPALRVVAVT